MLRCIDEACDKVFREHEGRIGFSKLLEVQSTRWNIASKSTSVLTLVQIACSKPLSPSHANGTISLYPQFVEFLAKKGLSNGFKGFISNRFGRKAKLAIEYLERYYLTTTTALLACMLTMPHPHLDVLPA